MCVANWCSEGMFESRVMERGEGKKGYVAKGNMKPGQYKSDQCDV